MSGYSKTIGKAKKRITFEIDPIDWSRAKIICNLQNISFNKFVVNSINESIHSKTEYYRKNLPDAYNLIEKFNKDNSILEIKDEPNNAKQIKN